MSFVDWIELRVKTESLAQEAKLIRKKEIRLRDLNAKNPIVVNRKRVSLYEHRFRHVRPESRAAYIALGFLTGKNYNEVENKVKYENFSPKYPCGDVDRNFQLFWEKVVDIVSRFGNIKDEDLVRQMVITWRNKHPDIQVWMESNYKRFN